MKKWFMIVLFILSADAFAVVHKFSPEFQAIYDAAKTPEVHKAMRYGAKAKIIYTIVDDEGTPIAGATVNGEWQNDFPRKKWKRQYTTDEKGRFVAEDKVGHSFACRIHKDGYYNSYNVVTFDWRAGVSPLVKDGKWQPYGENKTIILKKQKNPVKMNWMNCYAVDYYEAPATNVWVGLDMELGQWCHPYGPGKYKDVLMRFTGEVFGPRLWNARFEVSFTNNPYAGYYELSRDLYSDLQSAYEASTNDNAYCKQYFSLKNKLTPSILPSSADMERLPYGKYFVFRTRTKVDSNGKLISAHYGKIYGEWRAGLYRMSFGGRDDGIYFNPTPNDTNLEDMKTYKQSVMSR